MAVADARSRGLAFVSAACQHWPIYDHISFLSKIALNVALFALTTRLLGSWWRLRAIPGPFWAPFAIFGLSKAEGNYNYQLSLETLFQRYGNTIHIGPDQIVTTDFEALAQLTPVTSAPDSGFLRRMSQKLAIPYFSPQKARPGDEEHLGQSPTAIADFDIETVHFGFQASCESVIETAQELCLSSKTKDVRIDLQAMTKEVIQNFVADIRPLGVHYKTLPLADYFCAATDSMVATVHNTIVSIIASTVIYTRLREEVDATENFHDMDYLQSVAREGMRLSPVANTPVYTVLTARETIGGYRIPRGTRVTLNTMALMKSKGRWGADAELFRPERWMSATRASRSKMTQMIRAPWCVGEHATEMAKEAAHFQQGFYSAAVATIIMELFRKFDLSIMVPQNPAALLDSRYLRSKLHVKLTLRPTVPIKKDAGRKGKKPSDRT